MSSDKLFNAIRQAVDKETELVHAENEAKANKQSAEEAAHKSAASLAQEVYDKVVIPSLDVAAKALSGVTKDAENPHHDAYRRELHFKRDERRGLVLSVALQLRSSLIVSINVQPSVEGDRIGDDLYKASTQFPRDSVSLGAVTTWLDDKLPGAAAAVARAMTKR